MTQLADSDLMIRLPCTAATRSVAGTRRFSHVVSLPRRGLGLIELLTLVAVLMIGLAFVVATARHVRATSANELTRKRMQALADAFGELISRDIDPTTPLPNRYGLAEDEARIDDFARLSSRNLEDALATPPTAAPAIAGTIVAAAAGRPELDDAWGRPIALMPSHEPSVGMAPDDGPFLVSAGPDGRFLTLSDNIYSYDLPALLPKLRGGSRDR